MKWFRFSGFETTKSSRRTTKRASVKLRRAAIGCLPPSRWVCCQLTTRATWYSSQQTVSVRRIRCQNSLSTVRELLELLVVASVVVVFHAQLLSVRRKIRAPKETRQQFAKLVKLLFFRTSLQANPYFWRRNLNYTVWVLNSRWEKAKPMFWSW